MRPGEQRWPRHEAGIMAKAAAAATGEDAAASGHRDGGGVRSWANFSGAMGRDREALDWQLKSPICR
jgi:hypothetical protein